MARRRGWARRGGGSSWGYWDRPREPRPGRSALELTLGREPAPVRGEGRRLVQSFWGRAWCSNLERYHDYANRLPRGRTYLRQGAVLDLAIENGEITALVMGTSLYHVGVKIGAVQPKRWSALRKHCAGRLSSIIELLEGRLGDEVMAAVVDPKTGLFPEPRDIELACSCPDWATMCKHVAATLYGVGIRLDEQPRLLFELRGVDPMQLVGAPERIVAEVPSSRRLDGGLAEIFGVDIDDGAVPRAGARKASAKKASAKKAGARKAASETQLTRKQLLARGLPASTLQGWLRRRVLLPTDEPGVYALTDEARRCLEWYG
jgi:uncharacterized Zn finger protein